MIHGMAVTAIYILALRLSHVCWEAQLMLVCWEISDLDTIGPAYLAHHSGRRQIKRLRSMYLLRATTVCKNLSPTLQVEQITHQGGGQEYVTKPSRKGGIKSF